MPIGFPTGSIAGFIWENNRGAAAQPSGLGKKVEVRLLTRAVQCWSLRTDADSAAAFVRNESLSHAVNGAS
jgi:hypothetical protein